MTSGANRLAALPVPWKISPSGGIIGVHATEEGLSASLRVFLGPHVAEAEIARLEEAGETEDAAFNEAGYRTVLVTFRRFGGCRVQPQLSREPLPEPGQFDFSGIAQPGDRDEAGRTPRQRWEADNLCPDPGMYEVHQSDWRAETANAEPGLRHWLIVGHSAILEALASDYSWEYLARDS
ncbi:hypothetical protein [Roseomonas indoligenes]|uniref:Uncharacterized protein n=1 Tax=Roseomonas indoligenes TaxID=2820811 RepID=A0A940MTS6_9PROT|nr:hypothetical protein [Pararoseomonas indoligenes]MBP0491796.1 hypothetical protein [Pararoseomonas indoligenes]